MAAGELIISLLAETGSFETDTKRAQDTLVKLDKLVKQLQKTMAESRQYADDFVGPLQPSKLRPAVDGVENLNRAVQKSQAGFRASNQVMQQASYQVTDFVVQLSGGVSVMRAFGQQAPQLLAAFGGGGALAGVFIALGSAIADLAIKAGGVKTVDDALKSLTESTQGLSDVSNTLTKVDLSSLGKAYREANESGKELIDANVRLGRLFVEISMIDPTASFKKGIKEAINDIDFLSKAMGRLRDAFANPLATGPRTDTQDFASSVKITQEQAAAIDKARVAFGEGTIKAAEYKNVLAGIGEQYKQGNNTLIQWISKESERVDVIDSGRKKLEAFTNAQNNNYRSLEDNSKAMEKFSEKVQTLKEQLSTLTYGKTDTSELAAFNDRYAAGVEKVTAGQANVLRGIYAQIDAQNQLNQDTATIDKLNAAYDSYSQQLQKIYDDIIKIQDLKSRGLIDEQKEQDLMVGTQIAIDKLNDKSMKLGMTMQQAFGSAIQQGVSGIVDVLFEADKSFGQFAENFVKSIAKMIMQLMILQSIKMALAGTSFGTFLFGSTSANGNVFSSNGLNKFANGGTFTNSIVSQPTAFAYGGSFGGGNLGLMGEAGPEAIVPLKRSSTGRLGVESTPSNIVINVSNEAGGDGYQATATAKKNETGFDIDIMVRKAVTADLQRNGPMAQQMSSVFNLRRGA